MAILYGVVARGTTVLAEFSAVTGNTGAVVRRIFEKLCETESAESRLCFSQDRYIFHILRSDGLTFLCMANDTFGSKLLFRIVTDFSPLNFVRCVLSLWFRVYVVCCVPLPWVLVSRLAYYTDLLVYNFSVVCEDNQFIWGNPSLFIFFKVPIDSSGSESVD